MNRVIRSPSDRPFIRPRKWSAGLRALLGLSLFLVTLAASADFGDETIGDPNCRVINMHPRQHERITWSGTCKDGYADGDGTLQWYVDDTPATRYIGHLERGLPNGQGFWSSSTNSGNYVGEYRNGKRTGAGILTLADGTKIKGTFADGEPVGTTEVTNTKGFHYIGGWANNAMEGSGTATYSSGSRYVGDFKAGKNEGKGDASYFDGTHYTGEFKAGRFNGSGIWKNQQGGVFEGKWVDGHYNGEIIPAEQDNSSSTESADTRPRLAFSGNPPFPPELRRKHKQGTVKVRYFVEENGTVKDLFISESTEAAFNQIVLDWIIVNQKAIPATKGGVSVGAWAAQSYSFILKD